jgi:AcrR family transcriptional regulator
VREAVVTVVLQQIKEGNLNFTLQDIARLSGVHRTTIYGRWPDRASLLAEAVAEHSSKLQIKLIGDWKKDLRRVAFAVRDFSLDPLEIVMNSLLASSTDLEWHAESNRYWSSLSERLAEPIREAQKRGEVRADVDPLLVIEILTSAIVARITIAKLPPNDEVVEAIVRHLIWACTAPGADSLNPSEISTKRRTPKVVLAVAPPRLTRT